jgi:penicillin-binding protein 1A
LETRLRALEKSSGYQHQTRAQFLAVSAPGKPEYLQGAVVVLENSTGAIRAVVGGRNYGESVYNRALSAKRQVGSTFKPLVYAAGVEKGGLLPWTMVSDDPIQPGEIRSAEGQFSPQNSDSTFTGMQPMQFGLAHSRNTMSVRVGEQAGLDNVLAIADQAGVKDIPGRSAQIYIGNLGATLKSMTSAFSIFPNTGKRCRPYVIDHIENAAGETVFRSGKIEYEVVSPGTAYVINGMMQKVMQAGGTGAGIKQYNLKSPLAGKTGTTDDYKDAWFIGSTPTMTCGVWVGLDDPERIVGQGYGGKLAMPIWADVIKQTEVENPASVKATFPKPALSTIHICQTTGMLAGPNCPQPAPVEVPEDLMPNQYCTVHAGGRALPPSSRPAVEEPGIWQRLKGLFR